MSYIRSTSNPEALYIWSEANGDCVFLMGTEIVGKMPREVFDGLIKLYVEEGDIEYTHYKDAKVEELIDGTEWDGNTRLATRLSYKDWHIDMWAVTWYYIAHSNYFRVKPNFWEKILHRFDKKKVYKSNFV